MSQSQTETTSEHTSGGGKHRGPAAVAEENRIPAQGRHRRPAQESNQEEINPS
ncbi:hypothetical protein [Streptomyces gobiensis]|uniref:hypothetical protein n=1 Tax=Streptomyces gobiensis TaxID=2875706 RepID=UPI001E5BD3BB|nr:hypothetical protein [Streptomyces gobiensis]UGY91109.1 hypothetical protein test1122_04815 [Streptomyces gobiensis]